MSRPLQLNPPLWLETPKGQGLAHFLIADWEHDLMWVVVLNDGQIWTFANPEVRASSNLTIGRRTEKPPTSPESAVAPHVPMALLLADLVALSGRRGLDCQKQLKRWVKDYGAGSVSKAVLEVKAAAPVGDAVMHAFDEIDAKLRGRGA